MIILDDYIIEDFVESDYIFFGIHHSVSIYKHFHNPLITIFDQGIKLTVVTFQLEEFESIVTLDRMLPIYARDTYKFIDDIWLDNGE